VRRFENESGLGGGLVVASKTIVLEEGQDFPIEIDRGSALQSGDGDGDGPVVGSFFLL
jgi:hypothetical protein